jgi:basic membrane protein A and related proteins
MHNDAQMAHGDAHPPVGPRSRRDRKYGNTSEVLKVGFIYVGPMGDYGWSYAHDRGRQYLEAIMPDVETTYVESVPEGADAERGLTQLARSGHKVIVATSYGSMDTLLKVAERFPDVVFLHCSGHKRRANLGTYFGRMYQASYLTGLMAGTMTQKQRIGYVVPIPIPEVIRITNAFALGVRAVSPETTVHVVWPKAWYDPATESEAANSLLDLGADVIATQSDSPAPVQAAQRRGAYGIGFNADGGLSTLSPGNAASPQGKNQPMSCCWAWIGSSRVWLALSRNDRPPLGAVHLTGESGAWRRHETMNIRPACTGMR